MAPILPRIDIKKPPEERESTPSLKRIEYHRKNVYGNEQKYVTDPKVAEHVSHLTGTRTLMDHHVEALQALGHEVVHVPQN